LNPTLVRGAGSRAAVYMAIGEALMEEQTFRRLPPKLSQRRWLHKFSVDARVQEARRRLDMPEVFTELVEDSRPTRPVRREGKSVRGRCSR